MIVLDSNTIIHYLKGIVPVVERLHSTSPREVALPSIVAYEIEYGCLRNPSARRRKIIAEFIAGFQQIAFDDKGAEAAARIRIDLEKTGDPIGPHDLMIAATALSRRAILVTNNTREFSRVKGLELSDWTR